MTKTGIFFDFDGTLFYGTTDINYYSINLALQDMNRPPISREEANTTVGDRLEDACRRILHSDDQILCDRLLQGIIDHSPEAIRRYAVVEPDCVHMLQTLSRQAPLAICSNAEPGYLFALLDQFHIRRYFTYIWHRTPGYDKEAAIPELKKLLGVERAIMVGDRAEDVSSGKANGCITVAMQNDFGARDAIGADYDVYTHKELEQTLLRLVAQGKGAIDMSSKEILKEFMLTSAPSGYESEMAYKLKAHLEQYCPEVTLDRVGNVIAKVPGTEPSLPRAMIFGHMDQLGFIVRKVEEDGFIQVDRLGGIPEKVLPGLELVIRSEDGKWHPGVFGPKAHHATPAEEKYKVDLVTSLFIDVGASSAQEVHDMGIYVGCPVVYKPAFQELCGHKVTGTAVDNRGACTALVEIARQLKETPPSCDVYLVGTVWEEFNLRGAMMAARTVKPDLAISLDVTLAGDTKDLSTKFEDKMGQGPCVHLYSFHGRGTLNGTLPHEPMFQLAKRTARELDLPLQRFASLGILTDSAYIQLEGQGVACLEMGFPARYTHTPVEVCDVRDIDALATVCAGMMRRIDKTFQINRY